MVLYIRDSHSAAVYVMCFRSATTQASGPAAEGAQCLKAPRTWPAEMGATLKACRWGPMIS
eukprot:13922250-Alexandrium_andersonii.AAC.1